MSFHGLGFRFCAFALLLAVAPTMAHAAPAPGVRERAKCENAYASCRRENREIFLRSIGAPSVNEGTLECFDSYLQPVYIAVVFAESVEGAAQYFPQIQWAAMDFLACLGSVSDSQVFTMNTDPSSLAESFLNLSLLDDICRRQRNECLPKEPRFSDATTDNSSQEFFDLGTLFRKLNAGRR